MRNSVAGPPASRWLCSAPLFLAPLTGWLLPPLFQPLIGCGAGAEAGLPGEACGTLGLRGSVWAGYPQSPVRSFGLRVGAEGHRSPRSFGLPWVRSFYIHRCLSGFAGKGNSHPGAGRGGEAEGQIPQPGPEARRLRLPHEEAAERGTYRSLWAPCSPCSGAMSALAASQSRGGCFVPPLSWHCPVLLTLPFSYCSQPPQSSPGEQPGALSHSPSGDVQCPTWDSPSTSQPAWNWGAQH